MKIVVIGGSGLIGTLLVAQLHKLGHDVVSASRASGIDTVAGTCLAEAMQGSHVVVDVSNLPSFDAAAVLDFFQRSSRNLLEAERAAGVKHHVVLSIVGANRLPESGYMLAKVEQERLIQSGGIPFTIVRATQFFEFALTIAESGGQGDTVRLPPAMMQPIAAADVSAALADIALGEPANQIVELAGPESIRMPELARAVLGAKGDQRPVIADPEATYFGAKVNDRSLTPAAQPRVGRTKFQDWLRQR